MAKVVVDADDVKRHGALGAVVLGAVRLRLGDRGQGEVSHTQLASELGVTGKTLRRTMRALGVSGALRDLSPDADSRPHTYLLVDAPTSSGPSQGK